MQVFAFQQTNQMFEALLNGRVDATLFSAPTLHYYASHSATGKVKLVGPEFGKLDLGFVVQVDSPFRRQIDAALLSLREDGSYERLYDKWFGHE